MQSEVISLDTLKDVSYLSAIKCADFAEAAAVCLDHQNHSQEVVIAVEYELTHQLKVRWQKITQQIRDTRDDLEYATEDGAYCIAMLVVKHLTDLSVVKQSKKKTGFDYWLGKEYPKIGVQKQARLEVSGILSGTKGQINQRVKEKIDQTKRSDHLNIPAYIVIVEFSRPFVKIVKR